MSESNNSEHESPPDQITNVPTDLDIKPEKKKDPKKVAGGKALARKNKEAREALKKRQESDDSLSLSDITGGIQMAAGLIGSCFIIYHGYQFFYPPPVEHETTINLKDEKPAEAKVEESPPVPKQRKKSRPNIDME